MDRKEFLELSGKGLAVAALAKTGVMSVAQQIFALEDRVVLITGTGSGMGQKMALKFARAGFKTYATMREPEGRNATKARYLRDIASKEQLKLSVLELDVTKPTHNISVVNKILDADGRIDVLCNNAGILCYTPMEAVPPDLWDLQMRTNVYGPMDLVSQVMPSMRSRQSGLVITTSSRVGKVIIPGISLYCTSKMALETAVEASHYEATPQGIDFAILQPSAYDTDINRNARRIYRDFTIPLLNKNRQQAAQHHRDFLAKLDSNFSGQPNRNPQEVADLALAIANTPRNNRNLRYPIGDAFEIDPLKAFNAQVAAMQSKALRDSGYGNWYRD